MRCQQCGFENAEGLKFCGECGTPLGRSCPSCGFANPSGFKFCGECGAALEAATKLAQVPERAPRDYTPRHLADKILRSKSALEGERKQVTVLFADVKGSLELAEAVDPEEWHRVLDSFFQILTGGVHRYEGTISQYTGDGIMALFGAPIAHEDHAQRACYAALRLSDELRRYADELRRTKGLNFSVRMGLNSGEVVVGKIGDDLRMDYTAQGHTVGLAARMEQLAEPGKAYLTEHTASWVEGFCRLGDLGSFDVKGVQQPLRVFELEGVGPLRTRLEVAASRGLVRFVGRRGEMEQLRRAWESAREGRGQIVAVVGEAGVGKSRLVYEFKAPLERGCRVLEAFSVSHGKAYAHLPLIDLLKGYFGIALEDDERQRREKITGKVLTLDRTLDDALPYLFSLLGIGDETAPLVQMDPQIRRQRTLDAVKRVLVRETLDQPCVVIFEDLHWIDSETQAFLDLLSESTATARLLLLVNYRPEYTHGWGSKTYYTQLRLDPLGEEDARELLAALLGEEASAERMALEQLILEQTEGNPFFMEEVVQTLAEEGVLSGERGRYRLERSPGELRIPPTVQGVLAARIDRLPAEEKDLLQTLSVIGKEFSFGLLRRVAEGGEEDLRGRLSRLQAGEFIYEQPAFPEPEYIFKHALTQEVAYGSLLVERRRPLHERTARAIEELFSDGLEEHYGELAHHYGRSQNTPKAVDYLYLAGEQAVQRSAYAEAIQQVSRGVELLAKLPASPERDRQELSMQIALGEALMATQGYTAPEVERAYESARDLCEQVGESAQLFRVLMGQYTFHLARAELERVGELVEDSIRLARRTGDPAFSLWALLSMGETAFWRGEFCQARQHLEEAIARHDSQAIQDRGFDFQLGDPGVWALTNLSWTLWMLGYPEQASTRSQQLHSVAQDLSHPFSQASVLLYDNQVRWWRGEFRSLLEGAEALTAFSSEHGFLQYVGIGNLQRAMALAGQGELQGGIAGMGAILEVMWAEGALVGAPGMAAILAEAHGKAGQAREGLALIARAEELVAKTGERVAESQIHLTKGELLLARDPSDAECAEASFHDALEVARRQSARSWELRAATSLARLWQEQGRSQEARELLAPIYEWFTEGFDTQDLKDAKALLEELAW